MASLPRLTCVLERLRHLCRDPSPVPGAVAPDRSPDRRGRLWPIRRLHQRGRAAAKAQRAPVPDLCPSGKQVHRDEQDHQPDDAGDRCADQQLHAVAMLASRASPPRLSIKRRADHGGGAEPRRDQTSLMANAQDTAQMGLPSVCVSRYQACPALTY